MEEPVLQLSCANKNKQEDQPFVMNKITQDMQFRQSLLKYANKYGVTKAAIRYKVNRQYVYRWKRRYDGTWDSLKDRSHKPYSHPNQHTEAELKLIRDMRRRNPHAGLVVFWVKLRQRSYTRSVTSLYRILIKEASADADGEKILTCTVCKTTKVEKIKAGEAASDLISEVSEVSESAAASEITSEKSEQPSSGFPWWAIAVIAAVIVCCGTVCIAVIKKKK